MNRSERRAARRQHLDCGCTPRLLRPVERQVTCACGQRQAVPDVPMPTASPLASLTTVHVGCFGCGRDVEVACYVDVL